MPINSSPSDPRIERIANALVIASTLFMLAMGLWEIGAPVGAGHVAVNGSRGIIADNMLAWKIITPVRSYLNVAPRGNEVYAHHPWGIFWMVTALRWTLGRHDFIPRIYPVLMNTLLPGIFYGFGRALWGTIPGALCALGWVVLPISLAFAQLPGFEVPVVFGCMWVSWAVVRFRQTGLRLWGWAAVLGFLFVPHTDWPASLYAAGVCGLALMAIAFAPRKSLENILLRRSLRFWVPCAAALGAGLLFYLYEFQNLGQLNEWLHSAEFRASGNDAPLKDVLQARRYWLELMFTEVGIAVMLLGAVLLPLLLLIRRRFEDWLPVMMLAVWTLHYVHFKNGADIHIYWPQPHAAHFALSLGAIAAVALPLSRYVSKTIRRANVEFYAKLTVLGTVAVAALLMVPDAIRALNYSRNSGGRFNEHGRLIHQDFDKTTALRFFSPRIPERSRVVMDISMQPNWAQEFALHRPMSEAQLSSSNRSGERFRTLDSRFANPAVLSRIAAESPVVIVGPFWLIDAQAQPGPLSAYRLAERKPSWREWLFVQAHDPMLRVEPDPLSTWEWRLHLGQTPNSVPYVQPQSLEQMRIVHNQAVELGDQATARHYRDAIGHRFDRVFDDAFPNGTRLIGSRFVQGVLPKLELYFVAAGSVPGWHTFDIWSNVKSRATMSLVIPDELTRNQSLRFVLPPSLWKAGMIYVSVSEIRKRPGLEQFDGAWVSATTNGTQRDGNEPVVRLLELP